MQIIAVNGNMAVALKDGADFEVKIPFTPDLNPGEWVLVNANLALKKITAGEAEEINKLITSQSTNNYKYEK